MKKVIVTVVVVLVTVLTSNAQFFVGGSVGLDFTSGKYKNNGVSVDAPSTFAFDISPRVGYYLTDRWAIGAEAGIERSVKNYKGDSKKKEFQTTWGIGAFARYHLIEVNKFAFILEGTLGYQGYKQKTKVNSTTQEGDPVNSFGLAVLPVLSYNLTEHISIEANCDFLRLGFYRVTQKGDNVKYAGNYFGLGANYGDSDILKEFISDLFQIGIIYKF